MSWRATASASPSATAPAISPSAKRYTYAGPLPGQTRHRVHQRLVLNTDDFADSTEERRRAPLVGDGRMRAAHDDGHARADERRRVRHRAHDARRGRRGPLRAAPSECRRRSRRRAAGASPAGGSRPAPPAMTCGFTASTTISLSRDERRVVGRASDAVRAREAARAAAARHRSPRGRAPDSAWSRAAPWRAHPPCCRRRRIRSSSSSSRPLSRSEDRGADADERRALLDRRPRSRRSSPSTARAAPPRRPGGRAAARSARKRARIAAGSSGGGNRHQSLDPQPREARAAPRGARGSAAGATPSLVASPSRFTCTSTRTGAPRRAPAASSAARDPRSPRASARGVASATAARLVALDAADEVPLDAGDVRERGALGRPLLDVVLAEDGESPAATAARTTPASMPLVTPTRRTSARARPARRHAAAMRSSTAARRSLRASAIAAATPPPPAAAAR